MLMSTDRLIALIANRTKRHRDFIN